LEENNKALVDLTNAPKLIRRGVIYEMRLQGKTCVTNKERPLYIVEVVGEAQDIEMISVFKAQPNAMPPIKAFVQKEYKLAYRQDTLLGQLANTLKGVKKQYRNHDYPPLFMDMVYFGQDTFTGHLGKGFYERTQDRILADGKTLEQGNRTGVFISFDSIEWFTAVVDLSDAIEKYLVNKQIWFGGIKFD
jgi:hypothetical protein